MDYRKIYELFISDRRASQNPQGYSEKHHIIPRSLGGSNRKDNIIRLTPSDHLFAHRLLAKIYNTRGLWFAYLTMCTSGGKAARGVKATRRDYEYSRLAYAERLKTDHPASGKKLTLEHRASISASHPRLSGAGHGMFGKRHTAETKEKMRRSSHRKSGEDHAMFGKKHSPETISKFKSRWSDGNHPSISQTIISLVNIDGRVFKGRRYDFCKEYGYPSSEGNLTSLLKGRIKTYRGWKLS